MSIFNDSKCDCCVCPMQCALKQLVGQEFEFVEILTPTSREIVIINEVNDFIVFTSQGDYPICNVVAVRFLPFPGSEPSIRLKPIKKNVGECSCCEDPMTNVVKSLIGREVLVETLGVDPNIQGRVTDVGEGIAVVSTPEYSITLGVISTCAITRVIPLN